MAAISKNLIESAPLQRKYYSCDIEIPRFTTQYFTLNSSHTWLNIFTGNILMQPGYKVCCIF